MMIYGLVFILGLVLGSFYNVVALRTLSGENLAFPPSHCSNCNHQLHKKDLVPVFSWMFLKGKCRYCGDTGRLPSTYHDDWGAWRYRGCF